MFAALNGQPPLRLRRRGLAVGVAKPRAGERRKERERVTHGRQLTRAARACQTARNLYAILTAFRLACGFIKSSDLNFERRQLAMLSIEQLRGLPFFAGLNERQLQAAAELTELAQFEPNAILFHEGAAADTLYLPLRGSVDLYFNMNGRPNQRVLAGEIEANIPVGISALIEPHRYMMTARAATACRMLKMNGAALRALFETDPAMGYAFLREIAKAALERLHLARVQLAREAEPDLVI
ncbi:MAG: hypothetical protein DCC52_09270 [Chloroflexi bacterium]|nr:MAG: hypothetical protein DCC52_09270 [Chloroflexota bacterium]